MWISILFYLVCHVSDYPDSPEIDIAFAINTAATHGDKTFEVLKDAVKSIINKHNPDKLRYSVIVFDDSATPVVSFSKDPQDVKKLIRDVNRLSQPSGLPDLKKLLEEAKKVFESDSGRPKATKVLVVVTDAKSPTPSADIKDATKPLVKDGITVIAVAVGDEADSKQLEKMAPGKQNVLNVSKDEDPDDLGDEIINKILEGWCMLHKFVFCWNQAFLVKRFGLIFAFNKKTCFANCHGLFDCHYNYLTLDLTGI